MEERNRKWLIGLVVGLLCCHNSVQIDPIKNSDDISFYLDSAADCNGPIRNVYSARAHIRGHGELQTGSGPLSCKYVLKTEKPYEVAIFKIEIQALQIKDCGTIFTIYDGDVGVNLFGSFDCNQGKQPNMRPYVTTGNTVSFVLQREHIKNLNFDIDVLVTPIIAGRDPGYENNNGGDYGYNYHRNIPTEAIVGIVGGLFVVVIIVIAIVFVHCYRKHNRLNKRWEQQPLEYVHANSNLDTASKMSKSDFSDTSSVWASEVSKTDPYRPPHHHRSRHRPSEYEDSVVDDVKRSFSKAGSTRSGRTDKSRDAQPPGYYTATRNSFVRADDDHPQDVYVQREVPVRRSTSEEPRMASVGVGDNDEEDGVGDDEHMESEQEEEIENSEEEEEEEEEEDLPPPPPTKPKRTGKTPDNQNHVSSVPQPVIQDPRAQVAAQMMPPQQYIPYQPQHHPQQQFMPVQAMPYGYQQMPPGYQHPAYLGPQGPPTQADPVRVPSVKPTEPPIYSYLVQRGYTPLDGRQSPASMSSAASSHSTARLLKEEADVANLTSGVELMRR